MKSTPPRCKGIGVWAVGLLAVTLPWTTSRMLAESTAKTLYSVTEPGTWAGRNNGMVQLVFCACQLARGRPRIISGAARGRAWPPPPPLFRLLSAWRPMSGSWYKEDWAGPVAVAVMCAPLLPPADTQHPSVLKGKGTLPQVYSALWPLPGFFMPYERYSP